MQHDGTSCFLRIFPFARVTFHFMKTLRNNEITLTNVFRVILPFAVQASLDTMRE